MHLCVDYFFGHSPANSPGNVWCQLDFSLIFLVVPQREENAKKTRLSINQGRLSFHFFEKWMTDLATPVLLDIEDEIIEESIEEERYLVNKTN